MGKLFNDIRSAVSDERYLISWHADERCEERGITGWQLVTGLDTARLLEERPHSHPRPSVIVRQLLADGTEIEVVWSWLRQRRTAKLVTVYFPD